MSGNLDCVKPKKCEDNTPEKEIYPEATPAFSVCLGTGKLVWDGTRATFEPGEKIEDGQYSLITIENGCIVEYGHCEIPVYTPPYCAEEVQPCNSTGGTLEVSPEADNLTTVTEAGLLTRVYITGSGNIDVNGTGTDEDPFVVSGGGSSDSSTISGGTGIEVTGTNDTYTVNLKEVPDAQGTYNGLKFDAYGRFVGIEAAGAEQEGPISGLNGVEVEQVDGISVVQLEKSDAGEETYNMGGYNMSIDYGGRVVEMERRVELREGTYAFGAWLVEIDEFGQINSIEQSEAVPEAAGFFLTADNKRVSYDESGRIIDVEQLEEE